MKLVTLWRNRLVTLALLLVLVGLVFSPVLLSIGVIGIGVTLVLGGRRGYNEAWRERLPTVLRSSLFWGLAGLYLLLLLSVWQTYDWPYYLDRLRIKLPLLILPFAWAGLSHLPRYWRHLLLGFVSIVAAGILINYALDFSAINDLVRQGQALPVPRGNHVRYSLLVALSCVIGADGYLRSGDRWLLGLAVFLFVALHLLAVRSGLATVYAGLGVLAIHYGLTRRNYRQLAVALVVLAALPVVAYLTVPTFRTKLQYMRYELLHRNPLEDNGDYSDQGRITSIRLALNVWRSAPVTGVGYGNLRAEMHEEFARSAPTADVKHPHNQFVSALAAGGVVGLAATVVCFLLIGFGGGRWRSNPLFLAAWTMLTLSCLVENTLETSVGVTLFTLSLLLTSVYPPYRKPG